MPFCSAEQPAVQYETRTSLALWYTGGFRSVTDFPMSMSTKTLCSVGLVLLIAGTPAGSQVPGLPVLQNAFSNPGLALGANLGSGGGQSYMGLAAAWGLGNGRLQVSAGAGAQRANEASRGAYGARAAATVWTSRAGSFGVGAFGGIGGGPRTSDNGVVTNPAIMTIPLGATLGFRRALGATRGFSVYASPLYRWTRVTNDDVSGSDGVFRFSLGLDVGITRALGATVGTEFGSGSSTGASNLGVAVSWVPGARGN